MSDKGVVEHQSYHLLLQRLEMHAIRSGPRLLRCSYELTHRCNLKCRHCFVTPSVRDAREELDDRTACAAIDSLAEIGIMDLLLTGGEPLLHPDFLRIYERAWEAGMVITLFTNATLITASIASFLARHPPHFVGISIYGPTAQLHDDMTQCAGSFSAMQRGINLLQDAGVRVRLRATLSTRNQGSLPRLIEYAAKKDIPFVFNPYIIAGAHGGRDMLKYRLPPSEVAEVMLRFSCSLDPELALTLRPQQHGLHGNSKFLYYCAAGKTRCALDPYGNVMLCLVARSPSYNLRKLPLQDAWRKLVQHRDSMRLPKNSPCTACPYYGGDCPQCPGLSQLEGCAVGEPAKYFCMTFNAYLARIT